MQKISNSIQYLSPEKLRKKVVKELQRCMKVYDMSAENA